MRSGGDAGTAIHTSVPFTSYRSGSLLPWLRFPLTAVIPRQAARRATHPDKKAAPWQAIRRQTRTGSRE